MALEIGVHYWPLRKGLSLWREFDAGEVREDFARIAEWGLSPVQVSLLWEDFQPEPQRVNLRALDRLVKMAQMAMDHGLEILVAPFTGYLMGTLLLPPWMTAPGLPGAAVLPIRVGGLYVKASVRAPWADPEVRSARVRLLREVDCALRGHPTLRGWNLGHPAVEAVSTPAKKEILEAMKELVEELRGSEASRFVAFQVHVRDLEEDRGAGPHQIREAGALPLVEVFLPRPGWSGEVDDPLVPLFLAFLTRWLSGGEDFPVLELGFPMKGAAAEDANVDSAARYARDALEALGRHISTTVLWWPYGDDPFARGPTAGFGLVDHRGRESPVMDVLRNLRGEGAAEALSLDWIDLDPEDYWKEPGSQIRRLYERFRERLS